MAWKEGGRLHRIQLPWSAKPREIVLRETEAMLGDPFVLIFKCGMIWDGFIRRDDPNRVRTNWRHCLTGGRRAGKKRYNQLLEITSSETE